MKKHLKDLLKGIDNAAEVELKIREALEADGLKLFIDDGKDNIYIPKSRLDNKIAELATANQTIDSLQDKLKATAGAEDKIKALEQQIEDHKANARKTQLVNAIKQASTEARAKDADDLSKFLDMEKITLNEDGTVVGLKEQIEELQKSKTYLFEEQQPDPQPGKGFLNLGSPGKPSNLNAFGSKTTHEGDFGSLLGKQVQEQAKEVDSNYFFSNNK